MYDPSRCYVSVERHAYVTSKSAIRHDMTPPQAGAISLPPVPQDPPVLADVVRAKYYKRSVT